MFAKMTIGKRISIGFALILVLATALGTMAVIQMGSISTLSNKLAQDYAPEIDIVSSLERNARRVMYEMRGYAFTEDEKFLKEAKPWQERLQLRIKSGDELANKSKVLKALGPAMKLFKEDVGKYDKLAEDTQKNVKELNELRHLMDAEAGEYMKSSDQYLKGQNNKMKQDIMAGSSSGEKLSRLEKITLANDAVDLANSIRVRNFKGQALRDPKIYQEAINDFSKFGPIEKRLMDLTTKEADREELTHMSNAAQAYKESMIKFLTKWNELQEISVQRTKSGNEVVGKAEEIAKLGVEHTQEIASTAMKKASVSNFIMILGLVITIALGIFLSFVLIKAITGPIIKISNGLRDSSNQVSSASAQLAGASQELSSSSNEQASSIEETSSSLEEITGMVNNNVDNAQRCVEISKTVSESSHKGNTAVQELIASMKNILESNEKIQQLVKVIGEIGEKTAIIDEIVFQTKLLSFNASVEAERAGEHGRGFAVVAQEVGNLAQMSGKAATEISTIVKSSIKNAEEITTENKLKVETGNGIVKNTAQILQEIASQSNTLLENINSILSASKEQASGISQINTAVNQLDKATQENASTAEETASSSEELSAQAETLNAIVKQLTAIVTGHEEENTMAVAHNHSIKEKHSKSHAKVIALPKKEIIPHNPNSDMSDNDSKWEAI